MALNKKKILQLIKSELAISQKNLTKELKTKPITTCDYEELIKSAEYINFLEFFRDEVINSPEFQEA